MHRLFLLGNSKENKPQSGKGEMKQKIKIGIGVLLLGLSLLIFFAPTSGSCK